MAVRVSFRQENITPRHTTFLMPTPAPTRTRRSFWSNTCTRAVVASTAASHRSHPNSPRSQPDPRHHQQPHREVAAELAHGECPPSYIPRVGPNFPPPTVSSNVLPCHRFADRRPPLPPHRRHGACSPHNPNARDPSQAHTSTTRSDNKPFCFVIAGRRMGRNTLRCPSHVGLRIEFTAFRLLLTLPEPDRDSVVSVRRQRVPYEGVSRMTTSMKRKHRDRCVADGPLIQTHPHSISLASRFAIRPLVRRSQHRTSGPRNDE